MFCNNYPIIEKIVTFSGFLGPNDLALWLFQEVGDDYKDDIEKMRGTLLSVVARIYGVFPYCRKQDQWQSLSSP